MNQVVAAFSVVIACSSLPAQAQELTHITRWAKLGATYETYLSDRSACLQEGNAQASTMPRFRGGIVRSAQPIDAGGVASCMVGRGYVEDPSGFLPPDGGVPVYGGAVVPYESKKSN